MSAVRRVRNAAIGLFVVAAIAQVAPQASSGTPPPEPGGAGSDTSLPATDSQVVVHGRGEWADLAITVNQTADLANQAVSLTWTGGNPTIVGTSRFDGNFLQVMQCWGDDDGTVTSNPGPPPEQCVAGAADSVYGGRYSGTFPAGYALERLISRSDWAKLGSSPGAVEPGSGDKWLPFKAVDGTEVGVPYDYSFNPSVSGGSYWQNPYFNSITTNEIPGTRTSTEGKGVDLFEVTTGVESTGLGCGQKVQPVAGGGTKVPRCWLVVVPRGTPAEENVGTQYETDAAKYGVRTSPLAPSAWQHRISIPLEFKPVESSCDLSAEPRRIAGSELVGGAVSSWQPKLCATPGLSPFAYGTITDDGARDQLLSGVPGAPGMVTVSEPYDGSIVTPANPVVYAPLTVSGIAIGFNIERGPTPTSPAAELELAGIRIQNLNLTPRLVAKLLTQSYRQQTAIGGTSPYGWAATNPSSVIVDPDFVQFNPEFSYLISAEARNLGGFLLPSRGSDAARQLWSWVMADPEAKTWLDGTPDPFGMVVNPVYATKASANSTRAPFGVPTPNSFPKSDPYCYQGPNQGPGGSVTPPLLCGTDWLPYTQSFFDAAHATRIADDAARISPDPFAPSPDKVYRPGGGQTIGRRAMLSVVDSASAARYGVQMARLSRAGDDGAGRSFIAADTAGLLAGVKAMRPKGEPSVLEPDPSASAPTAYPLTAITYAATTPLSQDASARGEYAAFLDYAAGAGQVPGRKLGQLPPGYAPLPSALSAQTTVAATTIRTLKAPAAPEDTDPPVYSDSPASKLDSSQIPATSDESFSGDAAPPAETPAPAPTSVVAPGAAEGPIIATPILALARNRFVLPGLGIVALAAALGALEITKRPRRVASSSGGSQP